MDVNSLNYLAYEFNSLNIGTKVKAERSNLPTFHDSLNVIKDTENAQLMENPSDITFITTKNEYILLAKAMINQRRDVTLRLSNNSIRSYIHGHEKLKYWTFARDSLLTEPVSMALLWIMVRNCQK